MRRPNILITGTPGTGKTTTAEAVATALGEGFTHYEVGKMVKEKGLDEGWDEEYNCAILDEDKLIDEMEEAIEKGGAVVDFHEPAVFPERFFDLVVCLRADNQILYPRLQNRGYEGKKLEDNIQCEIFQTVLEECQESYKENIIVELRSETIEQMDDNVQQICGWAHKFMQGGN